jgi:hypothetical protein
MPVHVLANVELQLCMRACDHHTLIAFARCNKQLYAAASHYHAWDESNLLTVPTKHLLATRASSILRFAATEVVIVAKWNDELPHMPRCRAVDIRCFPSELWERLLNLESLKWLRRLCVYKIQDDGIFTSIVQTWPLLESVDVSFCAGAINELSKLMKLTDLRLHNQYDEISKEMCEGVTKLHRLALRDVNAWRCMLASTAIGATLLHLTLCDVKRQPWAQIWVCANLHVLKSLSIVNCSDWTCILAPFTHQSLAPYLRILTLVISHAHNVGACAQNTFVYLSTIARGRPSLHTRIEIPQCALKENHLSYRTFVNKFRRLQQTIPGRFLLFHFQHDPYEHWDIPCRDKECAACIARPSVQVAHL